MRNKRTLVTVIRERDWENEKWVDMYTIPANKEADILLRRVVQAYLETPAGQHAIQQTMQDFNWGDVGNYVPEEFLNRYGVETVYPDKPHAFHAAETLIVAQDEVLASSNFDKWVGWLLFHFEERAQMGSTGYSTQICEGCRDELVVPNKFLSDEPSRTACQVKKCSNDAVFEIHIDQKEWEK